MLILRLSHGWKKIEQCRSRRDTDHHGKTRTLAHAQRIESRRTLIGNGMAHDIGTLREIMHNG